jgi:hypothetical protein
MRELELDQIRVPTLLVEAGRGHGAKSVRNHFVAPDALSA